MNPDGAATTSSATRRVALPSPTRRGTVPLVATTQNIRDRRPGHWETVEDADPVALVRAPADATPLRTGVRTRRGLTVRTNRPADMRPLAAVRRVGVIVPAVLILRAGRTTVGSVLSSISTSGLLCPWLMVEHESCGPRPGSDAKLTIMSRRASPRVTSKSPMGPAVKGQ